MGVCNSKGMNATALTYKLDASNKRILDVSRDALLRIFTCAYAYRMTGNPKYLTKAETDMNAVCNFPTGIRNITSSMWAKWLRLLRSATTGSTTN